jgi:SAM-dependent methyltransferase
MSNDITIQKHKLFLPPEKIQGKTILDIGCFIGQTADWCISNGAAHYTGIEISPEFVAIAHDLMNKYHSGADNWVILNQGIDDFLRENNTKYDIIFFWGVIFGLHDHMRVLNELAQRTDHLIIDSRHPKLMWNDCYSNISDEHWYNLEYNIPYQEWQAGKMTTTATVNGSVRVTAANSSLAAIRLIMELNGFECSHANYEVLKLLFPNTFGMQRDPKKIGRFALECTRSNSVQKYDLCDQVFKDPELYKKNFVDWLAPK